MQTAHAMHPLLTQSCSFGMMDQHSERSRNVSEGLHARARVRRFCVVYGTCSFSCGENTEAEAARKQLRRRIAPPGASKELSGTGEYLSQVCMLGLRGSGAAG